MKLIGFAPDIDPETPGAITSCINCIPSLNGMVGAPTGYDPGFDALAATCRGAAVLTKLDGTRRVLAGTQTKIYELSGTSWTDSSRVGDYVGGGENVWRFAQFGNVSIATNTLEIMQYSVTGDFADIADAPKAAIVFSVAGFLMAFAVNDSRVGGDRQDAWMCSDLYDYSVWTPASGKQSAYGYFLDRPGEIRGGRALGSYAVAYKERSIHVGQYVGPPLIWAWETIPGEVGAVSNESIVNTGTAHLFVGRDDFYLFDGTKPVPIGGPVREWFFTNSDITYRYKIKGVFDKVKNRVWWHFASLSSGGVIDRAIVFDIHSGKWGLASVSIETAFEFYEADTTWDNWPPGAATDYEHMADAAFESPAWDTAQPSPSIVTTAHKVNKLAGACASSTIITGDFGAEDGYSTLDAVHPRFLTRPTTASMTDYTKTYSGDSSEVRGTTSINGNKFNTSSSGRLHRLKFELTGDYEIVGFDPKLMPDGEE